MKKVLSILMMVVFAISAMAKDKGLAYDISGVSSGNDGTYMVKVYVYEKKPSDALLKAAAVHGVVFRGFSGTQSRVTQKALTQPEEEAQHADFFEAFFKEDGGCQNFAEVVVGSYETVKMKKGYKTGAIINVNRSALRKHLEQAGVIKKLGSIF